MFGIGGFELFIILIFGFLIFGPDKLPDIAKTVGKGIARFRQVQQEVNDSLGNEKLIDLNNPDEPIKNPVEVFDKVAQRQAEKKAAEASSKSSGNAKGAGGKTKSATGEAAAATAMATGIKVNPVQEARDSQSSDATRDSDLDAGKNESSAPFVAEAEKAASDEAAENTAPKQETFTERKARYERERAARKTAEANVEADEANVEADEANGETNEAKGGE